MSRRLLIGLLVLAGFLQEGRAQGIRDSLFRIDGVQVFHQRVFVPGEAGLKISRVDSLVMMNKLSGSLSELLAGNTPVFIKSEGRGALATASFRGSDASHTQVTWNGMNINSPMLGMVDFSLVPVYLIDELSLMHGPASIEEGGGGLGGVISLGNKADWSGKPAFRYIQGIGSYSTFNEYLQGGWGSGKVRSETRLYHNSSANDYSFINRSIGDLDPATGAITNPLDTNTNADYRLYGLQQELYYRPGGDHLLSLVYWGQFSDRSIPWPTSYEGPDNANLNRQEQGDHRVVASWKYYLNGGRFSLRSGITAGDMEYLQYRRVPGVGAYADLASFSRARSSYSQAAFRKKMKRGFSVELKLDANFHRVDSHDTVTLNGYEEQRSEWSLYGSLSKSFRERLNLKVMLRQELVDAERLPLIPYFGLDFRLLPQEDLFLRASVARNYHLPTLNDLYWQPNGNPLLKPEEGFNLEGGLSYRRALGGLGLESGLSFYRNDVSNWIMWIPGPDGMADPINIERVLITGAELDMRLAGKWKKLDYRINGNYAWTRALNYGDPERWGEASYGKQLVYLPAHSVNLLIHLGFAGAHLSYQYNYYSERHTTSSNMLNRRDWLYPYFMNDLGLGYSLPLEKLAVDVELKVFNLFDESYRSVLYRPMPGRNYLLVIKISI